MESRSKNINSFWGYLLIEELARNNFTSYNISPRSRSTPLTIAAAENKKTDKIIFIDERTAAFHALGYGRATGNPAVVICTSGTAAANLYPAIIEAKKSQIPLILLTADRPPEWTDQQDGQTIKQQHIYQNHIKSSYQFPVSFEHKDAIWHANRIVNEAILKAQTIPQGPAHINVPIREPFYPDRNEVWQYSRDVKTISDYSMAEIENSK